jgi:hypothetical protein
VIFASPGTSRVLTITDYGSTDNAVGLYGFGLGADAAALASATPIAAGGYSISLSDGTTLIFAFGFNVSNRFDGGGVLHPYNFY